jgi:hypothetical protein
VKLLRHNRSRLLFVSSSISWNPIPNWENTLCISSLKSDDDPYFVECFWETPGLKMNGDRFFRFQMDISSVTGPVGQSL